MPLLCKTNLEFGGLLGLWQIAEEETYFRDRLLLSPNEKSELSVLKGEGRRLEWLSSRWLLHLLSEKSSRVEWWKDEFGKPHLKNSDLKISVTHSHQFSAALLSTSGAGVDIQRKVNKINRLRHKFVNEKEAKWVEEKRAIDYLHIIWGAKECMYKIYGRKKLDFRTNLYVEQFEIDQAHNSFWGSVRKNGTRIDCKLHFENLDPYFLVYGFETER